MSTFPITRLRRLRNSAGIRNLVRETTLTVNDLVYPLFIKAGLKQKQEIQSMPGCYQLSLNDLDAEIKEIVDLKIPAVLLFGIPESKDATGSCALHDDGIVQLATKKIKQLAPDLMVIADICCCEYTDHGHCGVVTKTDDDFIIDNDKTLPLLAEQSVSLVKAGADIVAPSGMIDGMVIAIRDALDEAGFTHIPILSYSVKYASSCYGPFRDAAEGAPSFGDRKTHQMDPANVNEAIREVDLDIEEGADILMIKPAGFYLDVISRVKSEFPELPLCAYQVSGEYSMIKAAAEKGWLDEEKVMLESLLSIKRAGADFIITYFAKDVARKI